MFKSGDFVQCKTPVGELERGKIYRVEAADKLKHSDIAGDTPLQLEGLSSRYYAFRFEICEHAAEQIVYTNKEIKPMPLENFLKVDAGMGTTIIATVTESASKNDQDKIDLSLIPYISSIEHAKAFMVGEKKYGRYNYCKGHKASQLVAAAERHLKAWYQGEEYDSKDGQHHLGSVMACCSMILRQQQLGTLKDDRYKDDNKCEP